ncbi:MAG TPA: hypothetical protein VM305_04120 [Candidatus Limnocylindrales bacterium]|nr:hypothetical protein [Candidatus Limnocylindrales bacterium]
MGNVRRLAAALGLAALLAGGHLGILPNQVEAAPLVGIRLGCYSNPETTRIKNNTAKTITIYRVGSTYQPYSYEPFTVNKRLLPGTAITYQTGRAATRNVLTRNYIYNDNGRDGVRVATSIGTFTKSC